MNNKKRPLFTNYNKTQISGEIVNYCHRAIVPDKEYINNSTQDRELVIEWFKRFFDFVEDENTKNYLADTYYQARFIYKVMGALSLRQTKGAVFIKVQILYYASIYEALIDYVLQKHHKSSLDDLLKKIEYPQVSALSSNTKMTYTDEKGTTHPVLMCRAKSVAKPMSEVKFSDRTKKAVDLNIISNETKEKIDKIYNQRNSIHILKAVQSELKTEIGDSKDAFQIMNKFCSEIKTHINSLIQK